MSKYDEALNLGEKVALRLIAEMSSSENRGPNLTWNRLQEIAENEARLQVKLNNFGTSKLYVEAATKSARSVFSNIPISDWAKK